MPQGNIETHKKNIKEAGRKMMKKKKMKEKRLDENFSESTFGAMPMTSYSGIASLLSLVCLPVLKNNASYFEYPTAMLLIVIDIFHLILAIE